MDPRAGGVYERLRSVGRQVIALSREPVLWAAVSACLLFAEQAVAQDPNISMHEEPRHRLLFEHDDLNLVEMSIPVGDTTFYHLHDHPTLWVILNDSVIESQYLDAEWVRQSTENPLRKPGTLVSVDNVSRPPHRVKNVGEGTLRMFALVHKGSGSERGLDGQDDAVELENHWFRVRRFKLPGNTRSSELSLERSSVVVQVGAGTSDVAIGEYSTAAKSISGGWSWHEGGTPYRLRNRGSDDVELVVIQAKD